MKKELQKELYNLLECSNCWFSNEESDAETCADCPDYENWEWSENDQGEYKKIYDLCRKLDIHYSDIRFEIRELNESE